MADTSLEVLCMIWRCGAEAVGFMVSMMCIEQFPPKAMEVQ
jgi:hypothetical protein